MINIAIVEDESKYSDMFVKYIRQYSKEMHIPIKTSVFLNGLNFLDEYKGGYDIILLDIAMPHMNGLEVAKRLRQTDHIVCIIFITTLSNYAIRGYEVGALDFVVKPVSYELFKIKLEKAISYNSKTHPTVYSIKSATEMRKVNLSDILYIESEKHYLVFHLKEETIRMRGSMKEIKQDFETNDFACCSSSLLVNLLYVQSFKGNEIVIHGEILPIARSYKNDFLTRLAAIIGGGIG